MQHLYKRGLVVLALLCSITAVTSAQTEEKFKIRITPVPLDLAMRSAVSGSGSGSAALSGTRLTITGTFEGLPSAATVARIHKGVAMGVRGSAFGDLTITKADKGTISGAFTLTPEQLDSLKKGHLYIQIHSEKAPDGTLWGWIVR